MARRLIDDCFLHDKDRLRHHEALDILRTRLSPVVGREMVELARATGRVSAAEILASELVPPTDNAAVDGYAFAHGDFERLEGLFPVSARIAAGGPLDGTLATGSAARIFTGGVMPAGADSVAMQEDCEEVQHDGQTFVRVPPGLKLGANRRRAGEDVQPGMALVQVGDRMRPQDVSAIASAGHAQVEVFHPVRVGVVSTGDEIVPPGEPLKPGQIYNTNKPLLTGLLGGLPVEVTDLGIWADDQALVTEQLSEAAQRFDIVLTTGGASRGEEDHLITAVDTLGKRHLWQLAIKPGRPMGFGQIGDSVILNLPGNPVAVFVCFLLYCRPAILALGGASWREPTGFMLPAAFEIGKKKPDRREFLRGFLVRDGATAVSANKFPRDGSGLISGLRAADGLIELPEDIKQVNQGDLVRFVPFSEFGLTG